MQEPINKKQIQLIHVAKQQLALDDKTYKETLEYRYNVSSSKDLSYNQASNFIGFLCEKGFVVKKKPLTVAKGSNIIRLATPNQHRLIEVLKSNIVWKCENGYELYIKKRFKLDRVITINDAFKVINGLKGMLGIKTEIIEMRALPFPWRFEEKWFKNHDFAWFYDVSQNKLVKLNVYGEEVK